MSRYIDADAYRKDLIELGFLPALVVRVLDKQPTADVVEVVRCKNCKYWTSMPWGTTVVDPWGYCEYPLGENGECYLSGDDYCSYGELKNEKDCS